MVGLERKLIIIIVLFISVLFTGCTSLPKDMNEKGENAFTRTVEAFEGLQTNDMEKMLLLTYGDLEQNEKDFVSSEIGSKVLRHMTFKVNKIELVEDNDNVKRCEVTITISSIDMGDISEAYEKIVKENGQRNSGIVNELLFEAIDDCRDEKEDKQVKLNAYLYPDIDVWRIEIDKDGFNALFPEYDEYIKWRYN